MRANRNILLDRHQEGPAFAQAIAAAHAPAHAIDTLPIPSAAMVALPRDHARDVQRGTVRSKVRDGRCNKLVHEQVIARESVRGKRVCKWRGTGRARAVTRASGVAGLRHAALE